MPTKIDTAPQRSSLTSSDIELMSSFSHVNFMKFIVRFIEKFDTNYPPLIGGMIASSSPSRKMTETSDASQ